LRLVVNQRSDREEGPGPLSIRGGCQREGSTQTQNKIWGGVREGVNIGGKVYDKNVRIQIEKTKEEEEKGK